MIFRCPLQMDPVRECLRPCANSQSEARVWLRAQRLRPRGGAADCSVTLQRLGGSAEMAGGAAGPARSPRRRQTPPLRQQNKHGPACARPNGCAQPPRPPRPAPAAANGASAWPLGRGRRSAVRQLRGATIGRRRGGRPRGGRGGAGSGPGRRRQRRGGARRPERP